jgi:ABC-type ATPase involved in cell division
MSKQLDQMIADAPTKNLGFAQALETLADLEAARRAGKSTIIGGIYPSSPSPAAPRGR